MTTHAPPHRLLGLVDADSGGVTDDQLGGDYGVRLGLDAFWAHGAALTNELDDGSSAVIITARPLSAEVAKSLRAR